MTNILKPVFSETNKNKINLLTYYSEAKKNNIICLIGEGHYLWMSHEFGSVVRFPEYNTQTPSRSEIKNVFKNFFCLVISYIVLPDNQESSNSILYLCRDKDYNIDKLSSSSTRRNIRLAQRKLKYGFAESDVILAEGYKAYSDTRKKVGLSDYDRNSFEKRFLLFSKNSAHKFVAAWFGEELIAFLSLIVVEDYVIIQGTFSTNDHKNLKPNNLLVHFVLDHYLTKERFETVDYGLSSIQEKASKEGLHNFKVQCGFEPIPVIRVFKLNPVLHPLKYIIRLLLKITLKFAPHNRVLKKAAGIFELIR